MLFGAALAAAVLTKATLLALFPALAIGMVAYVMRRRPGLRPVAVWVAVAGGTAAVLVLPYLFFNLTEYHAISGARAAAALIKPTIGSTPVNLAGAERLISTFRQTLFVGQGIASPSAAVHYQDLWEWTAVVTAAAAFGGAAARRRWDELAVIAWIVVSIPLGVITLIVAGFDQSGGQATVVARYLDCLLPLFAILVGSGAVAVLGSRVGSLALLTVLVVGSFLEVPADRAWILVTYTADTIGRSVPAVEQSYADGGVPLTSVRASAICPVDTVALDVLAGAPSAVSVNEQRSPETATDATDDQWTEYRVARPVEGDLVVRLAGPVLLGTARHLGPLVGPAGSIAVTAAGLPAVRLYCPVADPAAARFAQLYPTNHPSLSLGALLAWPEIEAWAEAALVAAAAVAVAVAWNLDGSAGAHRRRSRWTSS